MGATEKEPDQLDIKGINQRIKNHHKHTPSVFTRRKTK